MIVAAVAAGCGDEQATQRILPTPTVAEKDVRRPPSPDFVVIVVDKTISGGGRKRVAVGARLHIQVIANRRDRVRVGDGQPAVVTPGVPANLKVTPTAPGTIDVRLVAAKRTILQLIAR